MRRLASLPAFAISCAIARVASADATLAPGPDGGIGALLVAGPILARPPSRSAQLSIDFDLPAEASPKEGVALDDHDTWLLAASPNGAIDLKTALRTQGSEATAVASAILRATAPFRGYLALGADDGMAVEIDGKKLFSRDDRHRSYADDELVPVELAPGDHLVLVKLHTRGGDFSLHFRVTDGRLAAARDVSIVLPGVDPARLATMLVEPVLDRGFGPGGMSPRLHVGLRGGYPREAARDVSATAEGLFAVKAGKIPMDPAGPVSSFDVMLPDILASERHDGDVAITAKIGDVERTFRAFPSAAVFSALAHAEKTRAALSSGDFDGDRDTALATIDMFVGRITKYADAGDGDVAAITEDASALEEFLSAVDRKSDPFTSLRGARRLAIRSPFDGKPSPFALYLPPKLDPAKKYPLVVALHGLNGKPMTMLRWFFGRDDGGHDGEWEDRHPGPFPDVDGIVVAPMAHFNAGYRWAAERDVVEVMRWAKKTLPVDEDRVSITGPSMGGTGTAEVAFRYADEFASAAPLCGYHSYFLRGDMSARPWRPWEAHQAEERSNVFWAENGLHLPLYVVHGTHDLPIENSGVLIDKYKELGYSLLEEHPDEGHNVWQPTYEGMKGFQWLTQFRRPAHPSRIVFKTDSLRYDGYAWARIRRLEKSESWAEIRASIAGKNRIDAKTSNVAAMHFERDEKRIDASAAVTLKIDGTTLSFAAGEAIDVEKKDGAWKKGISAPEGLAKGRGLAGPIKDVYAEPIVVVWGTRDPELARANEEVARWFASVRPGWEIAYPVMRDVDFDPELAKTHAVVLVGGAGSNAVTRRLDDKLPIHVTREAVMVGDTRIDGDETGAAFVYPNPDSPSKYVVVLAGTSVAGTLRAMSMPDLLPDFVVWDHGLARSRGQMILGAGRLRAGGSFDESWRLPEQIDDPVKPKAK